jgi:hypothetical protein
MRKTSQIAANAFMNAQKLSLGNTKVIVLPNVTVLELFGNEIAYLYNDPERTLSVTTAGWNTRTTRDRLNAIDGVQVSAKGEELLLNGKPWDGKLIDVASGKSTRHPETQADRLSSQIRMTATIASLGSIFGFSTSENNDWRARMLKAGLPESALHMPENWDSLSEQEKDRRLTGALAVLKD